MCPRARRPRTVPLPGVGMVTTIVSVLTRASPCKRDIAMTGEITLRGRVRIADRRFEGKAAWQRCAAGLKTVLIPADNERRTFADIPDNVKRGLKIISVRRRSMRSSDMR